MASNLPGDVCLGEHSVCLVRVAKLAADCSPAGGADSGFITTGVLTATASPVLQDAVQFAPNTGCGRTAWTYNEPARIRSYTVSGELNYFDPEAFTLLFGGTLLTGKGSSDFSGEVVGWAAPNYTEDPPDPVYIEFITKAVAEGVGECSVGNAAVPSYVGHIFGRARFTPGDRTFEFAEASAAFTGTAEANPNLFDGPWNDFPAVGYIPNSPYVKVYYSDDEYAAIEELAGCGFVTLPAAS